MVVDIYHDVFYKIFKFPTNIWDIVYCLFSGGQHACAHTIICANSARVYSIMINIVNNIYIQSNA